MSIVDDLKKRARSIKIQNPIVVRPLIAIGNENKLKQQGQKRKKIKKKHKDGDDFFYNDLSYTVRK